jgi:hypothetical protein
MEIVMSKAKFPALRIPLDPPRGRLPRHVGLPGEKRRSINWPFLSIWVAMFLFWGFVAWRALH